VPRGRREFLRASVGLAATLCGCATSGVASQSTIDVDQHLRPGEVGGRGAAALLPYNATFVGHLRRIGGDSSGIGAAGIDYAPYPGAPQTLICPAAAGVVIGHRDSLNVSGMTLTIAHGLGWKTEYAHLQARFVGYGTGRVDRGDIIAIMGASGTGATRGGTQGPLYHVHLNLYGPAYTPLYRDFVVQPWPQRPRGYQYLVDAEDFSLAGRATALRYRRPEDDDLDRRFLRAHDAAVQYCDDLLDRLGDAEAAAARERDQWERATQLAYNVDLRIWLLWQRLGGTRHPFDAGQVARHRTALLEFITTMPRLTAPIVEGSRAAEYRRRSERPLKVYESQREFGTR
jgi:murein DD-endopeptidase MepM/ murein hydrolase activator NlpD